MRNVGCLLREFGFGVERPSYGAFAGVISLSSIVAAAYVGWRFGFGEWRGVWLPIAILTYAAIVVAYLRRRSRKESASFFVTRVDESTNAEIGFVVDSIVVVSALLNVLVSITVTWRVLA